MEKGFNKLIYLTCNEISLITWLDNDNRYIDMIPTYNVGTVVENLFICTVINID